MTQTNSRPRIVPSVFVASILLLLLAVILQPIFRPQISDVGESNNFLDTVKPDVKSALSRVKSEQCRQEIIQFVKTYQSKVEPLQRSCPLDSSSVNRVVRLGCSQEATSTNLSKPLPSKPAPFVLLDDDQAIDVVSCNELCFSFGHAFASYSYASHRCYCAEDGFFKIHKLAPCDEHPVATDQVQLAWYRVNNGVYNPTEHQNPSSGSNGTYVRIAFLLSLNGRSTMQVMRLLKRIYSSGHLYYIHVDRREKFLIEDLKSHIGSYDNIRFSSRRLETVWGGTALLSMMINAMEDLRGQNWHYLINLSESDFPVRILSELEIYLSKNSQSSIYLRAHNTGGYHFIKKQGMNFNFYQCEGRVWRLDKRQLPNGIIYTGGSDWFGLPKDFCDHIVEDRNRPGSLVYSLLHIFNYTLLPAESFFHTLARNGEFCDRLVDNNLRVTNWYRKQGCKCQHEKVVDWCGCSPSIYRWTDTTRLKRAANSTAIFFSRKFEPTVSNSIIGFVDAHLLDRSVGSTLIDTRYWLNIFDSDHDVLPVTAKRFGHLAVGQVSPKIHYHSIKSIHQFFDKDKFKGHVYEYCDEETCMELLVTPRETNQWAEKDGNCFNDNLNLRSLEVNQNFDTAEKLFRSHNPLDSLSAIVVHHEWIVGKSDNTSYRDISFKLINPVGKVELIQDAKLKTHSTANRLSLAHRLHTRKQLHPGLWRLILTKRDMDCLEYEFLVFDAKSHDSDYPDQNQFDRFQQVFLGCNYGNQLNDSISCDDIDWSLQSKKSLLAKYRL